MNKKSVTFKSPPSSADQWINRREAVSSAISEPTKRLTVDIPQTLHKRIKIACAERDEVMAEAVRALLEQAYPPTA